MAVKKLTLTEVVALGERRRSLESLRDVLASTIAAADPENVAALAKQLRDTMTEIAELPVPKEVSPVDELAKQRAARRATAKAATQPATGQQRRKRSS
jgi:hypothetical protein